MHVRFIIIVCGMLIRMSKAGAEELWPIPQPERDINKNLTQNTGY